MIAERDLCNEVLLLVKRIIELPQPYFSHVSDDAFEVLNLLNEGKEEQCVVALDKLYEKLKETLLSHQD